LAQVTKASTVLIDDDRTNIRVALEEGVRAHWIDPAKPDELPDKILGDSRR
jgi:FMN phosphatase YigB (HAD superfamily)